MYAFAQKNAQGKWDVLQATQIQHFVTVESEGDANKIAKMLRATAGTVKAATTTHAPKKSSKGKGGRPQGYSPKKAVIEAAYRILAEGRTVTLEEAAKAANVSIANATRLFKDTETLLSQARPAALAEQPPVQQFDGIKEAAKNESGDESLHAQEEKAEEQPRTPTAGGMVIDPEKIEAMVNQG